MSQTTAFLVRMKPEMAAWIAATAEQNNMSVPAYCRLLIEREQQRQKTVNSNFNPFKKKKEETTNGVINTTSVSGE